MTNKIQIPIFTLILMISFASVNAVLFTPALPDIAFFLSSAMQSFNKPLRGFW